MRFMSGWIAVKTAVGYIQDLVGKFYDVGFVLGSRCGSLAVGDNPVDDDAAAAAGMSLKAGYPRRQGPDVNTQRRISA